MRRVTRNVVIGIGVVVVLLLALGALPSLLRTGTPYYLTAERVTDPGDRPAINVTGFSERRYPYMSGALATGESEPYWKGPFGLKEGFSHSPFDELDALAQRDFVGEFGNRTDYGAVEGDVAYVQYQGEVYRLALVERAEGPAGLVAPARVGVALDG